MSDIKQARKLLVEAQAMIEQALGLMVREAPEFKTAPMLKPLTPRQKASARQLRQRGMSVAAIAYALKTNIGRVSEAINCK